MIISHFYNVKLVKRIKKNDVDARVLCLRYKYVNLNKFRQVDLEEDKSFPLSILNGHPIKGRPHKRRDSKKENHDTNRIHMQISVNRDDFFFFLFLRSFR